MIHINTEFLLGAVQMELSGIADPRIKSVDVTIINETSASISLNWKHFPFTSFQEFEVGSHNTLDYLRETMAYELLNMEARIKELTNQ